MGTLAPLPPAYCPGAASVNGQREQWPQDERPRTEQDESVRRFPGLGADGVQLSTHVMDTSTPQTPSSWNTHPRGSYVSLEGLPDVSLGGSPDHGILTHTVGVFLRPDHVGNHLYQPVLGEGIIRPGHIHLRGNGCAVYGLPPGSPVLPVLTCCYRIQGNQTREDPRHPAPPLSPCPRRTHLTPRPQTQHPRAGLHPSLHPET